MPPNELIQLLIAFGLASAGLAVSAWKLLDSRSASRITAERERAAEALQREKAANERASRYEAQRDQAMASMREGAELLAALATKLDASDRRCSDGLAALAAKLDSLSAALAASKQVVP